MADDVQSLQFTNALEAGYPTFLAEYDQLAKEEFCPWPEPGAYSGEWLLFPLIPGRHTRLLRRLDGSPVDLDANQRRCPESTRLLRGTPGLAEAAFSRLEPGAHVFSHVDEIEEDKTRYHLGLIIPEATATTVRIGDRQARWREGGCLKFERELPHETANLAASPRVVLICDFQHPGRAHQR